MIDELHVTDVALIHEASIQPASGLTVLTGETGTGKTALLSSIKLLVGERADASSVREGATGLCVEARLFLPGGDEDGIIARRRVSQDGRSRVEIDGHLSSVRELAERVGSTVDLCGQHEHQRLLRVQTHVELLDAWAGEAAKQARDAYAQALAAAAHAAAELQRIQEMGRSAQEQVDEAAFVLRRIDDVGPSIEEYEELEETLAARGHGGRDGQHLRVVERHAVRSSISKTWPLTCADIRTPWILTQRRLTSCSRVWRPTRGSCVPMGRTSRTC